MISLAGILRGLLAYFVVGAAAVGAGYLIISPIYRQVRAPRRKIAFYVIDFIALLALVQFALAGFMSFLYDVLEAHWQGIAILIALTVIFVWWASVDVLSQLQLRAASQRLTMHLVILPGMCAAMVLTACTFLAIFAAPQSHPSTVGAILSPIPWIVTTLTSIWLLRSIGVWLIRDVDPQQQRHLKTTSPAPSHRAADETATNPAAAAADRAPTSSQTTES